MFANELTPRSSFESWFTSTPNHPICDANFAKGIFDKRVQGIKISGLRRWRHFGHFFTLSNYRLNPAFEQQRNPMWKVQSPIDQLNYCTFHLAPRLHRHMKRVIHGRRLTSRLVT